MMFEITLLHPKFVHFTIALFSVAVLFDILALITRKEYFQRGALLNHLLAGFFVVVTVITGLLAASNVPHNDAAHEIMELHETIGYIVLGLIVLLLIWRLVVRGNMPSKAGMVFSLLALGTVALMFTGAYYGGEMVYTHGVAVKAVPVAEHSAGHHHGEEATGHQYDSDGGKAPHDCDMQAMHANTEHPCGMADSLKSRQAMMEKCREMMKQAHGKMPEQCKMKMEKTADQPAEHHHEEGTGHEHQH